MKISLLHVLNHWYNPYMQTKKNKCLSISNAISASCTLMKLFFLFFVSFYASMKHKNALIETFNAKALGKCIKIK